MYKIYYLTTKYDNQIRYIGLTKRDLLTRLKSHLYKANKVSNPNKAQSWILSRIKKDYNIEIKVIEDNIETLNEANNREKYWIKYFKDNGFDLVNSTQGGDTLKSYWKGKKQSKEHSEKIKNALKGRKLSKSHIETMRKNGILNMRNNKPVYCFDKEGNFLNEFKSCGEASRVLNIGRSAVIKCANGTKKSTIDYYFDYKENYNQKPLKYRGETQ